MRIDARELLALARNLIGFDTIRPGGSESGCARHLAGLLEEGGFDVSLVPRSDDEWTYELTAVLVEALGPGRHPVDLVLEGAAASGAPVYDAHSWIT